MLVTIYTDASKDHDTNICTWAAWIKCDLGVLKEFGKCPADITQPHQAEVYAIANSLYKTFRKFPAVKTILVNSDCITAMNILKDKYLSKDPIILRIYNAIVPLIKEKQVKMIYRHVKAHQNNTDIRTWLNNWCDQQAKRARKH